MKKVKMYKYIGQNGIVTTSVLLNGIPRIDLLRLIADNDKILTNGQIQVKNVTVPLEEIEEWTEIDEPGQD